MPTPSDTSAASPQADDSRAVRGRILWHDMMTPDVGASHRFYSAVLGWGAQEWNDAGTPYTMWTVQGEMRGGYGPLPHELTAQGVPPHWITYFGVSDVDAAVADAESRGARRHFAQDIPEVGRIAMLQDPQGAWFALFRPTTVMADSGTTAPVGDASWHELWTNDPAAAYDFYVHLLGWESAGEFEDPAIGKYRMFGRGGVPLGGVTMLLPEMKDVPPNWLPYFHVDDLDAAVGRATEHGGSVLVGPMEVPGGDRIAQCLDALGGAFALHQVA